MFSDGDDNQGIVLGVLFGVIALVIGLVIGLGIYKTRMPRLAVPTGATVLVPAAGTAGVIEPRAQTMRPAPAAGIAVEISVLKVYFEPGKSALPPAATQALSSMAAQAAAGRTLVISGFVDAAGELSRNEQLARERVLTVRNALGALGVPAPQMLLAMPSGLGSAATEADTRRVDVRVQ